MSLILDALRRKTPEREADYGFGQTARADSVLATLGYPRRQGRRVPPLKTLLMVCGAAVAFGFVGLSLLIFLLAPTPPPSSSASSAAGSRTTTVPIRGIETPRLPDRAAPESLLSPLAGGPAQLPSTPTAAPDGAEEADSEPTPARGDTPRAAASPGAPPSSVRRPVPAAGSAARRAEPPAPERAAAPAAPPAPSQPKEDTFGLALYYHRIGDFGNALAQYRKLLEQNDGSAEVHNNLGLLYQGQDQFDDAIRQFQRAIAINPKYGKAHNNLGVALMRSGQTDAAAAEFRVALAADPRNVESMVNLALIQRAAGGAAEARDLLQRAVAIDPRNAGSHYNLAVAADQAGDTAIAIEHYRAFLKLGAVAQADLSARVRARLIALGG